MIFRLALSISFIITLTFLGCAWTTESMFPYLNEHKRLEIEGEDAQAEILSITQTGWTLNDQPELELDLKIYPPGETPYYGKTSLICPLIMIPNYRPGGTVPVKIDKLRSITTITGSYRQTPGLQ